MLRKLLLPVVFLLLGYGFWVSEEFKAITAGVAVFLFGMISLEEGFKTFTGGTLEKILKKTTSSMPRSLVFGIVTTSIMQSSSLVSVITISFLSAGLLELTSAIGIVFGANLGTTTGAWLVAGFGLKVNLSAYAMPMLVFGVILIFQKSRELKGIGYVLAGLGFLFLGIHHMKEGFDAFKDSIDLTQYAVAGYPGIFLFALLGLVATVVMQSSHATLVLIITALAAQQITYENALALAIGANIGTTITAIIGSLSSNVEGRRLAGAHLIFNAVTALVAILFIYQLAKAVDGVSAWLGIATDDYTLKLAVFHTLFNALGIILMLPFMNILVTFLENALKPRMRSASEPLYLNDAAFELGDTAIETVRKETVHLYDNAFDIIAAGLSLNSGDILSEQPLDEVVKASRKRIEIDIDDNYNERVKNLYAEIVGFISSAQVSMTTEQAEELFELRAAGRDIVEAIKDTKHLQKNLSNYLNSDNLHVREEYDKIRFQVATVMRQLDEVRKQGDDSALILSLDALKLDLRENDSRLDSNLDKLVRNQLITPQMATSLMNDGSYSYDVSEHLIKMGEILFSTSGTALREAERSLAFDDDDITELLGDDSTRDAGGLQ